MRTARQILVIGLLSYWFIGLLGCASLKEGGRCLIGISTKEIEATRKNAISKSFNYKYNTCYIKALKALDNIGAYIFAKNEHMIAIYVSEEDTTPVGLFFKEIDSANTQIEVSSPSTYAKESISSKVFSALEGKPYEKK